MRQGHVLSHNLVEMRSVVDYLLGRVDSVNIAPSLLSATTHMNYQQNFVDTDRGAPTQDVEHF